jgi:ketosteroid isomerase-like protein
MAEHPDVARLRTGMPPSPRAISPLSTTCSPRTCSGTPPDGISQRVSTAGGRPSTGSSASSWRSRRGTFRLDLHTVLADDEHGVALAVATASRGGRSMEVNEAHVFHLRDGKVVGFWNVSTDQYAADELIG